MSNKTRAVARTATKAIVNMGVASRVLTTTELGIFIDILAKLELYDEANKDNKKGN